MAQDWFEENSPKKQSATAGKDWFTENAPVPPDFTPTPGKGTYRMSKSPARDPNSVGYMPNTYVTATEPEIPVSYDKVQDAIKAGYNIHFDDAPRYQKDSTHEGQGPTLIERATTRIHDLLEPSKGTVGQLPSPIPGLDVNAVKAAGRVVAGTPSYLYNLGNAVKRVVTGETNDANELLDLIDPTQMPEQMYNQFREDWKKDPKLAVDNLMGTLAGLGFVAAVTHGAQEKVGTITSKGINAVTKTPRATLEAVTDTSPRQVREMAEEVQKKNQEAIQKAAEINKKAQEEHETKKTEAEHATKGREIEHKYDVHQTAQEQAAKYREESAAVEEYNTRVHDKAAKKYDQDVKEVHDANQKTVEKYAEEKKRIEEENKAAEHTLELRRAEEAKLEQETTDYYAKEDAVKAKVKGAADAKWNPLHQALDDKTIDGGFIEKPLAKITEISPEVRREIRQLIPEPADAEQGSPYVQKRNEILKAMGHKDPVAAYKDMDDFGKANVDRAVAAEGLTPDPIDLDPKTGVDIPFDKLHRAQSIIGRNIRNGRYGYEGPLLGEIIQLQKVLHDAETKIATDNGLSAALNDARKATREYQEAFGRARNTPKNQVDLRKQQANPEQFKEENEQERVEAAKKHDPSLAEDYEKVRAQREKLKKMQTEDQLRKSIQQVPLPPTIGDLRSGYKLNPLPVYEPPTIGDVRSGYNLKPRPSLPPAGAAIAAVKEPERVSPGPEPKPVPADTKTISPEDYKNRKVEHIKASAKSLRSMGLRRAMYATMTGLPFAVVELFKGVGASGAGEAALGGLAAGGVVLAGSHMLANLVERPDVAAWLSNITEKDAAQFRKLPPEQKALFTEDMKKLGDAAQKKGIKLSPAFAAFVGIGAAKQSAQKNSIDEVKKQVEELQKSMHLGGFAPAPPTGVTQ